MTAAILDVRPAALPWKLDTQRPSTDMSARAGKSSTARSKLTGYFRQTGNRSQPAERLSGFAVQQ